jgi:hypothetical protein
VHLPFNATRQSSRWIQSAESPAPAPTQCPDPFTLSTTHPDQGIPDPRTDFDPLTAAFPAEFPQPDPSQVSDRMLPPTFPRKVNFFMRTIHFHSSEEGTRHHRQVPQSGYSTIRAPLTQPTWPLQQGPCNGPQQHSVPWRQGSPSLRCFIHSHPANRPAADSQHPHVSTQSLPTVRHIFTTLVLAIPRIIVSRDLGFSESCSRVRIYWSCSTVEKWIPTSSTASS